MALAKKTRQPRTASGSIARVRPPKATKRVRKSGELAIDALSDRELRERFEGYLKRTGAKTPKFLQRIHEQSKKNGTDKLTLREINAVIKEARRELRQKQK